MVEGESYLRSSPELPASLFYVATNAMMHHTQEIERMMAEGNLEPGDYLAASRMAFQNWRVIADRQINFVKAITKINYSKKGKGERQEA